MYDIHCHILPGVDDGAVDMEEAVQMAYAAEQAGMEGIVCTPHYIEGKFCNRSQHNTQVFEDLCMHLKQRGVELKVFPGNEVFVTPDIISLLEKKEIITINASRYILIEMPVQFKPLFLEDVVFKLRLKGLVPIIAHPERYEWINGNMGCIASLISKGCLAQLNLPSLNGFYGEHVRKAAKKLVKQRLIHLLGSDGHSSDNVYEQLNSSLNVLKKITPEDVFIQMLNNTKAVIDNKEISNFY